MGNDGEMVCRSSAGKIVLACQYISNVVKYCAHMIKKINVKTVLLGIHSTEQKHSTSHSTSNLLTTTNHIIRTRAHEYLRETTRVTLILTNEN